MPWIRVIPEAKASDDLAEVYREKRKQGAFKDVPEGEACFGTPYSLFTQNGAAFKWLDRWQNVLRYGRSELSRAQREMIATVTSQVNHCVF